ncbi:hypothetical protein [Bacillus sp. 166amftsu]|uniref:hypothetical protein n=1 Tax=Bacillus sp. 166amftsu TaxID=1761753 RepID=UPI00089A9436|nr:hypothetical protein [Bacillus sp. 166amftsu]SDZ42740.1 hypothetical protein SAMN04488156_1358 [Bacillus sp. 166amftsu]
MNHKKKIIPAALAFAVLASPVFSLKAEASTIAATSSAITSVEKENPSLNLKEGQVSEENSNVNQEFDANYINNNIIKANFPSVTPPHIKEAKPLEYLYLDYSYVNGNKIIGDWRNKELKHMDPPPRFYYDLQFMGYSPSQIEEYFGSTYGESFVKGLVLETLESFFQTRYAQDPNDPDVQKILHSKYYEKSDAENDFFNPEFFEGEGGLKRAILEEFGKKSLDELGIQVIWGDNNWGAEKAVTIGYSAKTPFNPLKDAVLTEKKYLKKVPGGSASIPAKNTGYEVTFDIKTGLTNEQSQSFAHTVGVNAGVGIEDIFEIGASYEFQSTFGTSISLSEEQTVSRKFSLTNESDRSITAALYQVTAEYSLKPGSVATGIVNKTVKSPFAQFWQGGHYWDTSTKVKVSSTSTGAIKTDDLKLVRSDVLEK